MSIPLTQIERFFLGFVSNCLLILLFNTNIDTSKRSSSLCDYVKARRFYSIEDMMNLYPFIQGSLEWPFSELFSANVSSWNQYKYIAFNIFSCRILIASYKMLIIKEISNKTTNELTIYGILCWNVTMFYRQELGSLFQGQEKLKAFRNSKLNFLSSCFIANYGHVKVVWVHVVVFSEHDILHFWNNFDLFIQWKYCSKLL